MHTNKLRTCVHATLYIVCTWRIFELRTYQQGDRGSTVVKVLCYKSEGRWFDPSWCQWSFHWHKILLISLRPWGRLSLWQKWVPGVFPGGKSGRCVRLTSYPHPVPLSRNLGTLTCWNPLGLSRPVMGLLYIFYLPTIADFTVATYSRLFFLFDHILITFTLGQWPTVWTSKNTRLLTLKV